MIPPPLSLWHPVMGLLLSLLIGAIGFKRGSLTMSGLAGAVITGTATFGLGGWGWGMLLVAFFVSSSALSRFRRGDKAEVAAHFAKTGRRDLRQALANGGLGSLLAVAYSLAPDPLWVVAFVGAMAAVNADTWGTEVGILYGQRPRLITTWQEVPPGTSGGVSVAGSLASLGGALLIGVLAAGFQWAQVQFRGGPASPSALALVAAGLAGGAAGSTADSLLGATVQRVYHCPACNKETEQTIHRCGTPTQPLRGWPWLDNDVVNLLCSAVGATVAAGLVWLAVR